MHEVLPSLTPPLPLSEPHSSKIINLSSRVLSAHEVEVLARGLRSVPSPTNADRFSLNDDLQHFSLCLRLTAFSRDKSSNDETDF